MRRRGTIIALSLLLDLLLGDPPNRYHPVAWMGRAIGAATRRRPVTGRALPLARGAAVAVGGSLAVAAVGRACESAAGRLPPLLSLPAQAAVLKTTVSARGLAAAALAVQAALASGDLAEARRLLSWHLVSRDTSSLDEAAVAAATIESVAENTSDGVVAALLFYAVGGLPAAAAYRFVNTCDAMLGYRDPAREWLGKAPARLDDLANLVPARATALLLLAAAALLGEDHRLGRHILRRDHGLTSSPNAGYPMSAVAGALGVELEKRDHYRLGKGLARPQAGDIGRSVRLMYGAVALLVLLARSLPPWPREGRT